LLVPTDLSALGNAAIRHACRMLSAGGGTLIVCHATGGKDGLTTQARDELRKRMFALIPAEAARMGIHTRAFVQESAPPEAIVQAARRLGCEGIVLSSHGRSGLSGALLGSVAEAIVRESPVPVTVVSARAAETSV
jgi:nucleotide-binding universal stress UspA family protein